MNESVRLGPAGRDHDRMSATGADRSLHRPPPFSMRLVREPLDAEQLGQALVRYAATTTGDVVVDCSNTGAGDWRWLEVVGRFDQRLERLGRRVRLRGLSAEGERAARLGGWGRLLGGRPTGPDGQPVASTVQLVSPARPAAQGGLRLTPS